MRQALEPIFREVTGSKRDDEDPVHPDDVGDVVGKHMEVHPVLSTWPLPVKQRMCFDSLENGFEFAQKAMCQLRIDTRIVGDCGIQVVLGRREDMDGHPPRCRFLISVTASPAGRDVS